ncbi:APC family permease [Clostridiaceae bacterium 35-E11]
MSDNTFKKELSISQIIALAAGGMIAAWMVEIKYWFELSGPGSLWALLTCAALVLPLCLIYSELTSTLPFAGGENIWISNAFNWNIGWFSCWALILMYVMAMPTVSYGIASMIGYVYPIEFSQVKIVAAAILLIWFVLTNFEIKFLARIQSIMFYSTLVVSIVASLTFIFSNQWSFERLSSPWFTNGIGGYGAAVGLLIMKFVGFDLIPQLAEETNFPKNKLWIGFVGSLGLTVLVYGLAVIGCGGIVTTDWVLQTDIVDPRVADILGMHWLGVTIVIMGSLTCLTTLSGFWLSASRTLYGASNQRQLTTMFTSINKLGQPWKANIAVGILSMYFTVFAPEAWINYIYSIYGITAGFIYFMVVLSFMILRRKKPDWHRPYKVKGFLPISIVSLLFTVWIIISSFMAMNREAWIVLGAYVALGVAFWGYAKMMQKRKPEEWEAKIITLEDEVCEHA